MWEDTREQIEYVLICSCVFKRVREERSAWAELFMFIHSSADLFTGLAIICSFLPSVPLCLFLSILLSSSSSLFFSVSSVSQSDSKLSSVFPSFKHWLLFFSSLSLSYTHTYTGVGSSIGGRVIQSLHTHTQSCTHIQTWVVTSVELTLQDNWMHS